MTAYYNEIEPFAAQWLRNLIQAGHIAFGEVDERSIEDVQPDDVRGFAQCHFFAGIGVWSHALRSAGWEDARPVWTGSCPCQPFSCAGKQLGTADKRHLWPAWFRLIRECRPPALFGEQVAGPAALAWLDLVSADLEDAGYAVGAADLCAAGVGAPSVRQRLFWMANSTGARRCGRDSVEAWQGKEPGRSSQSLRADPWPDGFGSCSTLAVTDVLSPSHGIAGRVGRLRAYGNTLCAPVAAEFVRAAMECMA